MGNKRVPSFALVFLVFTVTFLANYGLHAASSTNTPPTWARNDSYSTTQKLGGEMAAMIA